MNLIVRGNVRIVELVHDLEGEHAGGRWVFHLEGLGRANERNCRSDKECKQNTTKRRFHIAVLEIKILARLDNG